MARRGPGRGGRPAGQDASRGHGFGLLLPAAAEKALNSPAAKEDEELRKATRSAIELIYTRFLRDLAQGNCFLDNGYPIRAKDLAAILVQGAKGDGEMEGLANDFLTLVKTPEVQGQIVVAKAIARIEAKLFEDGADSQLAKRLRKIGQKNLGLPVALRAEKLLVLASVSTD